MNRLKELREEAMMTVRELSERSGVSEDTITKIENGHRKGRGVTLRKLAKGLGVEPRLLSPEYFERSTGGRNNAVGASPSGLVGTVPSSTSRTEPDIQDNRMLEAIISRVYEVIGSVEAQSGLAYRGYLELLSERQREALLAVAQGDGLNASTVAEQTGCSVSTAYRDLAVLGEHGFVSCDELGQRWPTRLGKEVAGALNRDGLYFEEALKHVATLLKAYETVAGLDPHRVTEEEAGYLFWLQESVVRSVERIAAAAEPPPFARTLAQKFRANSQQASTKNVNTWG